ncbi:GNAT family N-acetyltransferase [Lacticaseibacillus mingshuiensis]|uniref:GNAT family N-acetyltransferase n=1 Tax=Lacticaseibacillus mingshuiensis TaxID=2799574 RepID=A0ABW4CGK5_9LACO|nr:GNAT family N-acetyltransferase [Lacticaseibacillus mingshuiensis]
MTIEVTKDLTSTTYQDALAIRTTVFVEEQNVPADLEVDSEEARAIYFVAYDQGLALGTARLLKEGYGYHVQRVAVLKAYRHHGIGAQLLDAIVDYAQAHDAGELRLGAQLTAVGFYKGLGFHLTEKPEFLDAGIRHREMALNLTD